VIASSPPRLLLEDEPRQPKEINLLHPRVNETLTGVKTNMIKDVMCAKYKSVTPCLSIDGVRAAPEQVKVMSPKKKKKRAPPSIVENNEKHQQPTIAMLQDKIKTLTNYTHAL
jgi:hypothetical protein